jgi:hypothetical protein
MFGYKNAFSPIIGLVYKNRVRKARSSRRKFNRTSLPKMTIWIGVYGFQISITRRSLERKRGATRTFVQHAFDRFTADLRGQLIALIQNQLSIKPYTTPKTDFYSAKNKL